jgi:hypothetical protein
MAGTTVAGIDEPGGLEASRASQTSLLEASLFCLVEHLRFRNTLDLAPYPNLVAFAQKFGERKSANATPYVFDVPPTTTHNQAKGGS